MPESSVRPDSVNVAEIMEQIRARIREKRGVDYSEQQVRDLAATKLDKLLDQFSRAAPPAPPPSFEFERQTLVDSRFGAVRLLRRLLSPLLRLFFNADAIADALHTQSQLNARQAQIEAGRSRLYDELIHNLVIESARLGLDVKNLKMRVESLASRLEFSERRARSLESAVFYKPAAPEAVVREAPAQPTALPPSPSSMPVSTVTDTASAPSFVPSSPQPMPQRPTGGGPPGMPEGQRRRRRRRRRGRRGGGLGPPGAAAQPGAAPVQGASPNAERPPQHDSAPSESTAEHIEPDDSTDDSSGDSGADDQ